MEKALSTSQLPIKKGGVVWENNSTTFERLEIEMGNLQIVYAFL